MDQKDIPVSLMNVVKDVMSKNQNLYQQDLMKRYGFQPEQQTNDEPVSDNYDSEGTEE